MHDLASAADVGSVRLADSSPFSLGPLLVEPALRQVSRGHQVETLEPRTMQVLVALAEADGAVASRDRLVDRCWDGRIVGDDSITRVIAQLRRLSEGIGAGAFTIETIPRVGYRLVPATALANDAPQERHAPPTAVSRRSLVLAAAGTTIGAGAAAWWLAPRSDPLAAARARLPGHHAQQREARALLEAHLAHAPDDPDALGLLALVHGLDAQSAFDERDLHRIEAARRAADRALARDPGNADALVADALLRPMYRQWAAYEAAVSKALARAPDHWAGELALAAVRLHTGRPSEALGPAAAALAAEPMASAAHRLHADCLWGSGQLAAASQALAAAHRLFPLDGLVFSQRMLFLAVTGRPGDARAMAATSWRDRPPDDRLPLNTVIIAPALDALEMGDRARREAAIARLIEARRKGQVHTPAAVLLLAALGDADAALSLLPSYFLGAGPVGSPNHAPPHPGTFRLTHFLFLPPMAPLWPRPDFAALLADIGLDRFWRETGTTPDFRR
ncbi:winged helix-turn-helix domain-containing protein [Thermaurantiacus sp.]